MTFETARPGRVRRPVTSGSAPRPSSRRSPRAAAPRTRWTPTCKGNDLAAIRTRQTLAEPQPEFLSIVPFTGEIKEPRYRLKALEAEARNASYIEYEIPYTRDEADRRVHPLPPVHLRGDRVLRPAPPGHRVRHDAQDARASASTRARATGRVTENRFTGVNHDYVRDDSHAFILREPSRCIDCGRCANVCAEVVGAACYDFMRIGFDTLVTTPLDMSLNDTPCVSCGRCAETCPTGALMPKPRVLQKYEVDESRCILCGICVDACPYDAVRDSDQFELSHTSREEPMIDLLALAAVERETEMSYIRRERDWAERARAEGRILDEARLLPVLPRLARAAETGTATGTDTRHGVRERGPPTPTNAERTA